MSDALSTEPRIEVRSTEDAVWLRCLFCGSDGAYDAEPVQDLLAAIEDFVAKHAGC